MLDSNIAESFCFFSRLSYDRRLVTAAGGNTSYYLRPHNEIWITPTNLSLRDVTPERLIYVNKDGAMLGGPLNSRPSKETGLHLAVYQEREEANCVFHLHPHYATAFSCLKCSLPLLTASTRLKLRTVPLVPFADPGSAELVALVRDCLSANQEASAILLAEHGILVWGKTAEDAFNAAELVEEAAHILAINTIMSKRLAD